MNSSRLCTSAFGLLAALVAANPSCAPAAEGGPTATGGSSSTTGGASTGTGGAATGGASVSTGGLATATGGASTSTGGASTSTGGASTSTGGASAGSSTGGAISTGGATVGGAATGGSAPGGSSNGGSGGATGGAATGGAATGGAATGGAPAITIESIFPSTGTDGSLDGMLSLAPCKEKNTAGTDCNPIAYYKGKASDCSGGALNILKSFNVGGTPGAMYKATLHFYGIAEPKNYGTGVMREASGRPGNSMDGKGATPTPWATAPGGHTYPGSDYNTYEIHVLNNNNMETAVYYLNADTSEGHWVYVLNYEKTITVVGGGKVNYRTYDRNCRQIKNCGVNAPNNQCAAESAKRVIDVSAALPMPTTGTAAQGGLLQPQLTTESDAGNAGQWLLIDVTKVEAM